MPCAWVSTVWHEIYCNVENNVQSEKPQKPHHCQQNAMGFQVLE